MKKLKMISTILLSLVLLFSLSTVVRADDENDWWGETNVVNSTNTDDDNSTSFNVSDSNETTNETTNDTSNSTTNSTTYNTTNSTSNNSTNNTSNTNTGSSTSNTNGLASTGASNSGGAVALIIVVSVIIALYSAKKFNEYKNL